MQSYHFNYIIVNGIYNHQLYFIISNDVLRQVTAKEVQSITRMWWSLMFLHSRIATCQSMSSALNPHRNTRINTSNVFKCKRNRNAFLPIFCLENPPSHIAILVGITSRSKCSVENLETFEASTNTPSEQICHIDPSILSWNFPKLPKASSKFRAIEQQAHWGNWDSTSRNEFGV